MLVYRIQNLYHKIAPPRISKITFLFIYLSTLIGGVIAFLNLPTLLIAKLGPTLISIFGSFCFIGSLFAIVAVLPCIKWLERSGIMLLMTATGMYIVMLILATRTTIALWLVIPLICMLIQRLAEISTQSCTHGKEE